jgi:hypothetical protein
MEIDLEITIISHLSDAQELISMGQVDEANKHINFSKRIIMRYGNIKGSISEEKLDEIWSKMNK